MFTQEALMYGIREGVKLGALYMVWSGEKYFPDAELTLSLDIKYRSTDNEATSDTNKSSARLSAHKKF